MTVQVTLSPPGTTTTYSYDPASGAVPQVPAGPGLLRFQDVLPDGTLGPVWGLADLTVVAVIDGGLRVRFPDGTEIALLGGPQLIATLLGEVAPAAGDGGNDSLFGETGSDALYGDAFDDFNSINGGLAAGGDDRLVGGLGGNATDTALVITDGAGTVTEVLAVIQNVDVGDLTVADIVP